MMNLFNKLKEALFKTKSVIEMPEEVIEINEDFYTDLLEKFIKADIGFDLSEKIVSNLKNNIKNKTIGKKKLQETIKEIIKSQLPSLGARLIAPLQSGIYLMVGVNGSGKTTSIGKLAKKFKDNGKKILIVAGDTFRAAAGEQLEIWTKRADVEIFSPSEIKKPDAVVYQGLEKAKKENYDVVLIDTAGRLQSQTNLMDELKKINSVIEKNVHDANIEKLIVLDATIGQNSISQAKEFSSAVTLTGIILAKLDSSAKGGVVLNIMNELSLPVKFIGTGEQIDDLVEFNFDEYLDGLLT